MPSWGSYHIFPPILTKGSAGREHKTDHIETSGWEGFDAKWEDGRWRFGIGGAVLHPNQIDLWDAFVDALRGMYNPFLFRFNSRRFEITEQVIGTGDGVTTEFQLQKTRSYPYGPANSSVEVIRYPWHDYPPLLLPNGRVALATEYVRVWANGTAQVLDTDFTIEREGGEISFASAPASGASITASCKYLVKVHGLDWMPVESEGGQKWEFPAGAELFQAKGET